MNVIVLHGTDWRVVQGQSINCLMLMPVAINFHVACGPSHPSEIINVVEFYSSVMVNWKSNSREIHKDDFWPFQVVLSIKKPVGTFVVISFTCTWYCRALGWHAYVEYYCRDFPSLFLGSRNNPAHIARGKTLHEPAKSVSYVENYEIIYIFSQA